MTTFTHTMSHLQKCTCGIVVTLFKLLAFNIEGAPWWRAFPWGIKVLLCASLCCHWSELLTHFIFFTHCFFFNSTGFSISSTSISCAFASSLWLGIQENVRKLLSELNLSSLISPVGKQEGEQILNGNAEDYLIK